MIYLKCDAAMGGATVATADAEEALQIITSLRALGVQVVEYTNEAGDPLTLFTLEAMATDRPIRIDDA